MTLLDFREPVSAWTHGLGVVLSVPATILLWRRAGAGLGRRISLVVFGLGLFACYAGSTLFHAVRLPKADLDLYDRLDHVGIFLLIAGSYTPVLWNLTRVRWRSRALGLVWGTAAAGSFLYLLHGVITPAVGTSIYLGLGWGAILIYLDLARRLSHRALFPLLFGGILYSVGAVLNLARWPNPWAGVVGAHEVFHLFVLGGSLAHFLFVLDVVIPDRARPTTPGAAGPSRLGSTAYRPVTHRPETWRAKRAASG